MAMKQCKRFKRFVKEKFMPSKKVDGKEDLDDEESNSVIEGYQGGDQQGTQTQKRKADCDEVYQDLGLCLRDCIIKVEKNNNKSDQTGTL